MFFLFFEYLHFLNITFELVDGDLHLLGYFLLAFASMAVDWLGRGVGLILGSLSVSSNNFLGHCLGLGIDLIPFLKASLLEKFAKILFEVRVGSGDHGDNLISGIHLELRLILKRFRICLQILFFTLIILLGWKESRIFLAILERLSSLFSYPLKSRTVPTGLFFDFNVLFLRGNNFVLKRFLIILLILLFFDTVRRIVTIFKGLSSCLPYLLQHLAVLTA